ncbi:MAG: ribose 5-phosphate isomerase B [Phycisphaerae bacterium]|nr:ribose 5-phosphate isomerase B [Phycisphaerae bacterium]
MKIAIGSDHRGFDAKERVKALLSSLGFDVTDYGTDSRKPCDYTRPGFAVARAVASHEVERGILFCGSGIGMSITANKVRGIRAALCHDELTAQMARRHNDANILCLPADLVGDALTQSIVRLWLDTQFEGGRHARRVAQITAIEEGQTEKLEGGNTCK